jgi:enediyne biosynthesis protein E4
MSLCQRFVLRCSCVPLRSIVCLWWIFLLLTISSCKNEPETLFQLLEPDDHGIRFVNTIQETDSLNILTLEYVYNGGGVAIGDFNNDGLSDVFMGGNIVPDRLFLNEGDLKFRDVSDAAGLQSFNKWRSGVAVADVNSDGLLDIYVCATIKSDSILRENILYINKGVSKDGVPTFVDEARNFGVADNGHSSNAAFLDYDLDGDMDLYVLTNTIEKGVPTNYRQKVNDGSALNTDRLYRNNGDNTFTNVSSEAGIIYEGYGLGLAISDINKDGWPDIYVSNDYISNDLLYINNGDGTFSNKIDDYIKHQSQFSMGNDVADINNDAYPDIVTLDMLPETNLRRKTVITPQGYSAYINNAKYGYAPQHVRNMLQLNNGNGSFSEIGQLAGIHQTEWSWSPLLADFDNDGFRDCFITNGFPRDITDKDFGNFRGGPGGNIASVGFLLDSIPVVKVPNYAFRNNGDLTFTDVTASWGMNQPSFSNGAAFADFDNDGDLDYVVNNINGEASLYRNNLYEPGQKKFDPHFLRIKLSGPSTNATGLGSKVYVYTEGKVQYHDHSVYRGYISSVENVIHFGLGKYTSADSLRIEWPDSTVSVLKDVKSDQVITVDRKNAVKMIPLRESPNEPLLRQGNKIRNIDFVHHEPDVIDFNFQRTLPHKFSQQGPAIAVGDINNDGRDDFYIAAPSGQHGTMFVQTAKGSYERKELLKSATLTEEDQGALFLDVDGDGDQDLYVVSGGFAYPEGALAYQDRLYMNDGRGGFTIARDALPSESHNGSCVRAADFDRDGDLDLFIGGLVRPAQYPFPAESFILRNDGGKFKNVTDDVAPGLKSVGLVNDALWSDCNNDGRADLILAGEFMPITIFANANGKFTRLENSGLEKFTGWWSSIASGDFDNDGDTDYIGGNLGLNNYYKVSAEKPLKVYAKDLDDNKSVEAVLTCYFKSETGEMKEYPIHFWDELNSQSPKFRRKFEYYRQYGKASIDKLLTEGEMKDALVLQCNYTSTSYIENSGNGKFLVRPLPVEVQFGPVKGMITDDINADGYLDVLITGNDYGNEVFSGRYDAHTGTVLLGDGKGGFSILSSAASGFFVDGDAKALVRLAEATPVYIAAQNTDSLLVFEANEGSDMVFHPESTDTYAVVVKADGRKEKIEFYYGSGYYSQSTRTVFFPADFKEVTVHSSVKEPRKINPTALLTSVRD